MLLIGYQEWLYQWGGFAKTGELLENVNKSCCLTNILMPVLVEIYVFAYIAHSLSQDNLK